jgi:predicted ATPase
VEGVIEERIGQLGKQLKDILMVASVEGGEFTAEVIAQVLDLEARQLVSQLSGKLDKLYRLVAALGSRRIEQQRLSFYGFRHSLFHKHLYNNLDEVERAYLHEEVGSVLERLYGHQAEDISVQLAHQFSEAGMTRKAIHYLLSAAQNAKSISANEEAITHLMKGLQLVEDLPEGAARNDQELQLLTSLGVAQIATLGYAAPEVEETYYQARAICDRLGDEPSLFPVLYGLRTFYLVRAQHHSARDLAEQMLAIAQRVESPDLFLEAHQALGTTYFYLGELEAAKQQLELALEVYDLQQHQVHAVQYGQDPAVASLSYLALTLWWMGYPDEAVTRSEEALRLAELVAHPFSMALAQNFAAMLYWMRREESNALEHAQAAISIANKHTFPFWHAMGTILRGAILALSGEEEGFDLMQGGLGEWEAMGAELGRLNFQLLLALALERKGERSESLRVIEEALETVERTGDRLIEAELLRVKGTLTLGISSVEDAEADFRRALKIAQGQSARSLELRAGTSLFRLLHEHGRRREAADLLSRIYRHFTEGFETPDLKEAQALLNPT